MKRSRVLGAAALALATGIGALTAVPAAAGPAAAGELTVAPLPHQEPSHKMVFAAGPNGVTLPGPSRGLYWKSFADGRETPQANCDSGPYHGPWLSIGDTVGCEYRAVSSTTPGPLTLHDQATGHRETLAVPAGLSWTGTYSPTQVLATEKDAEDRLTLHLIGREKEPRKDVTVSAPERIPGSSFWVRTSDEKGALITYRSAAGQDTLALLDFATAALTPLALPEGAPDLGSVDYALGYEWVSLRKRGSGTVTVRSRTDLAVTRSVTTSTLYGAVQPVGDWLVAHDAYATGDAVTAVPVDGGAPRTLLARSSWRGMKTGTDGSAYLAGGTDSSHWAMYRIKPGPDGAPALTTVVDLPPNPADRVTLSLAQGRLITGQENPDRSLQSYDLPLSGTSPAGQAPDWSCEEATDDRLCAPRGEIPGWTVPTGDGRIVSLTAMGTGTCGSSLCGTVVNVRETRPGGSVRQVPLAGTEAMSSYLVESASGRYVMFSAMENRNSRMVLADIDAGRVLDVRPSSAATLWGSTLWDRGDDGEVTGTDLRTGTATQRADLGCRPYELQASGDWLYFTCSAGGAGASAFHLPSKKRIQLPFTPASDAAKLGDGYVAHRTDTGLEVYNLRSGAPVREREIAQPLHRYGSDWTVDRFGGRPAYTDAGETVHVVGVTGKASPLAVIDQDAPATVDFRSAKAWSSRWWLSKPVSSWQLTVRNKTSGISTVVRSGGEARGVIAPAWDGKNQGGAYLFTGDYEWTLTARPADGQTPELRTSGSMKVTGIPSRVVRPPAR
ncbi:hypothetical protein [Streptomyces subrutilus]|uniref:hypothetical protein n=1 Tax=Streptomyces subrutilus TaxID=36818 RepID=UPI000B2DB9C5|nr:hypothetical protein [Streptomyces subrutilus]